jgi:hypothetical protein
LSRPLGCSPATILIVWTTLCTISAAIYAKIKRSKICRKRIHFIHTYIFYTLLFYWINYGLKRRLKPIIFISHPKPLPLIREGLLARLCLARLWRDG